MKSVHICQRAVRCAAYQRKGAPAWTKSRRSPGAATPAWSRASHQAIRGAQLVSQRRGLGLELRGDDRLGRWVLARQSDDDAFRSAFGRPLPAAP
jgi:hypothetical protein